MYNKFKLLWNFIVYSITKRTMYAYRHVTKLQLMNINFNMMSSTPSIFVLLLLRQFTKDRKKRTVPFAQSNIKKPTKTRFAKSVKLPVLENRCKA